jgi:hypothetical protein
MTWTVGSARWSWSHCGLTSRGLSRNNHPPCRWLGARIIAPRRSCRCGQPRGPWGGWNRPLATANFTPFHPTSGGSENTNGNGKIPARPGEVNSDNTYLILNSTGTGSVEVNLYDGNNTLLDQQTVSWTDLY